MKIQVKKRRICQDPDDTEPLLPILSLSKYYTVPCLSELANLEVTDPGYCSRVHDFTVGRLGYGCVKFLGATDVRWLNLDQIIKFSRHKVVVYRDEKTKPVVGQGLNKAAEVTLVLRLSLSGLNERRCDDIEEKLRQSTKKQGAQFISYDRCNGEWKFLVGHFSRFGLSDDEEEDITMDDSAVIQQREEVDDGEVYDIGKDYPVDPDRSVLSHSLPLHLGLDPIKMNEMRMVMFPTKEEDDDDDDDDDDDFEEIPSHHRPSFQNVNRSIIQRSSPPVMRKTPLALIEYHPGNFDLISPGTILMTQQNKGVSLKRTRADGFKLDLRQETPTTRNHACNVVDAALFMGRSFRVGWGPNGVLVHSGAPVNSNEPQRVLSSIINLEKIAIDKVCRDDNDKVRDELVSSCFDSPLNFHKELNHETEEIEVGPFKLKLQKLVTNQFVLPDICRSYIAIVEGHLEVSGLSSLARNVLMHQVMVWELTRVLFSEREYNGQSKSVAADNEEDMMHELDTNEVSPEVDPEALPLIRRAQFSYWLQESVGHRVQSEISYLNESGDLEHIFQLLTGRQLTEAVELAASRGDVRLACLLSQAGGSVVNRSDIARQLDIWADNGLDFNLIEKERIWIYKLLAGDIHGAFHSSEIDWKRFLGLLMWYQLPPDTQLPIVFHTYQQLLTSTDSDRRAPYPVPVYIDEGPAEEVINWNPKNRFDLAYYLMLLHANADGEFGFIKTMFSAFSSTPDPLDYHMIWHQRSVLEAVGAFSSNDLYVLDMGLVSQLLCLGQCHWAIYVVLHMPHHDDYPYLHATVIREILFQYCESWSSEEKQRKFIEDLGVPSAWLHEAMAVYYNYHGDLSKALEHFIECANWQKAHVIFVTSVAHSLFLSDKHSEIWTMTCSMEDHKSEIENWDLGAGLYISFYQNRDSLQDDNNAMSDPDSLDSKNSACKEFFKCLSQSLAVWGSRLPLDARVVYSKMAEVISELLSSDSGEGSTREDLLRCYDTMARAPVPEDLRSCYLQDAVTLYTHYLSEIVS